MITGLGRDELIAAGARLRASYLDQQAGYTLGAAAGEGEALAELLEPGYLDEVSQARDAVHAALQDKELVELEAKAFTRNQDDILRQARVWRRKVVRRASGAQRMGRAVPDVLLRITRASTVPSVVAQLTTMTAALGEHTEALGGARAEALLTEGSQLLSILRQTDAAQENARLVAAPQKVQDFYAKKGELYVGLKVINDAAHELFAAEPERAKAFNLKILYRNV